MIWIQADLLNRNNVCVTVILHQTRQTFFLKQCVLNMHFKLILKMIKLEYFQHSVQNSDLHYSYTATLCSCGLCEHCNLAIQMPK